MAILEGFLPWSKGKQKKIDTVIVPQNTVVSGQRQLVHRKVLALGDPENIDNYANVATLGAGHALCVSELIPIVSVFAGFGEQEITGAINNVDIWGGPDTPQPEPDVSGFELWVESDDAADDGSPVGTGVRTIGIHYLDTAGVPQVVTATMNGVTPVDTGVSDCMFVQEHHALTVGSVGVAVGNVDCTSGSAGAIVSRIRPAGNQSMSTVRQVPAGNKLVVTGWHVSATAATTKLADVRIRSSVLDGVSNPGVYHFRDSVKVKDFSSGHMPIQFECPALSVVKISAWTTGTIGISARWAGHLEVVT